MPSVKGQRMRLACFSIFFACTPPPPPAHTFRHFLLERNQSATKGHGFVGTKGAGKPNQNQGKCRGKFGKRQRWAAITGKCSGPEHRCKATPANLPRGSCCPGAGDPPGEG